MNHSVLLDISLIPTQMAGLASLTKAIAMAMLAFIIPWTVFEMTSAATAASGWQTAARTKRPFFE